MFPTKVYFDETTIFPFIAYRLITVVFALSLLGHVRCSLNVRCTVKVPIGEESHCYIAQFPDNPNREAYTFLVDYIRPCGIEYFEFSPSRRSSPAFEYIPSEIFTTFPNLKRFTWSSTSLSELRPSDFSAALELNSILLNRNKIKAIRSITFSPLSLIAKAVLNAGGKIKVDSNAIFPLYKLERLWLNENEISEIEDYSFYGLIRLTDMNLADNQLTIIRQRTFVGLLSLAYLDLSDNRIETIEDGALKLPSLIYLELSRNKLKRLSDDIFQHSPAVEVLKLKGNELEHIGQSLQKTQNLTLLSLDNNRINDLDLVAFAKLPHLNELSLENSGFSFANTTLEDCEVTNSKLGFLNLGDNNLSDPTELLQLKIFSGIRRLGLQGNSFTDLNIGGNKTLKDILPSLLSVFVKGMEQIDCGPGHAGDLCNF